MQLRTIALLALVAACSTSLSSTRASAQSPAVEQPSASPPAAAAAAVTSPGIEALRAAAKGGDFERFVDQQATATDLFAYYALGSGEPGFGLVAAKVARLYAHEGDTARAREAATHALEAGAGGRPERVQAVLDRLSWPAKPGLVGVVLPLKGKLKSLGEAIRDGMQLAAKAGGIELVVKDSEGDPELAAQAVEALAREGAIAILGPVGGGEAKAAALRAQELGVPMVSLSRAEGLTSVGSWIFRNSLTNSQQGKALARYAAEVLGVKEAGVLSPDLASSAEVSGAFWDTFEQAGGAITVSELYAHDQTTFSSQTRRLANRSNPFKDNDLKEEARKLRETEKNPYKLRKALEKLTGRAETQIEFDVLLIPDYYRNVGLVAPALAVDDIIANGCDEKALEMIKKTQKRKEIRTITLLGTSDWNHPDLLTRGGRYVDCSVFVDGFYAASRRDKTRQFASDFQVEYGRPAKLLEAQGYDAAALVRDVIQRERPATRDALRAGLARVRKFPGATGDTTFSTDREGEKPLFFLKIIQGVIEELDVELTPTAPAKAP